MILTIAPTIPAVHHQALRALIDVGFANVDHHDVEIHVRSRPARVRWAVHYRSPVAELPPELRRRWLASHPGAASVPTTRAYRRRRDAVAAAARLGGTLRRHVDDRLRERMSACAYYSLPDVARVAPERSRPPSASAGASRWPNGTKPTTRPATTSATTSATTRSKRLAGEPAEQLQRGGCFGARPSSHVASRA